MDTVTVNGIKYKAAYIGDGVYALHDGSGTWLHTEHHEHPTNKVYLDPGVIESLKLFWERVGRVEK